MRDPPSHPAVHPDQSRTYNNHPSPSLKHVGKKAEIILCICQDGRLRKSPDLNTQDRPIQSKNQNKFTDKTPSRLALLALQICAQFSSYRSCRRVLSNVYKEKMSP